MKSILCFEVLLATVVLWVAIFGMFDIIVSMLDSQKQKGVLYVMLALGVIGFLMTHESVSVCALM